MTLSEFLLARIAEDEEVARAVHRADHWHLDDEWRDSRTELVGGGKILASFTDEDRMAPLHIARHDPARVLAECEAKRRIVDDATNQHTSCVELDYVCQILAAVYADHPDYRPEWKP